MRKSKDETLATRRAILKVALDCFSKRGYALTTFADIAERLHLTKGAIFWHYKSKEELLAALIVQEHEVFEPLAGIEEVASLDGVKACFIAWVEALLKHRESRQFMLFAMSRVEWSDALKEKLKSRLDGMLIKDPFERLLEKLVALQQDGVVAQGVDAKQATVLMCSVFFGTLREAWLHKREIDIVQTVASGLEMLLQGIRSR